jgi:hypothetical protein
MDEYWRLAVEQRQCLTYPSTRFEQELPFVTNKNIQSEVVILLQVINYLVGKMVNINNDALEA